MSAGPRPWVRLALPALLAAAFALRAWYAVPVLNADRFYDERYSLANVHALVVEGGQGKFNGFYPSLSFLPQSLVLAAVDRLHRATGVAALAVFSDTSDGFTATAYLLCRWVTALFAILGLWATYRLGRRLFSPEVGLLAAVLLAAMPAHLGNSALFKPDMLVVLLTVVAFGWGLDAGERPSARRFLLAGCGVGLAVAAKYTGVGVAIPVAAAALYGGWRERRRWGGLALAGLASAVTFVALNPHLPVILSYLPRLQRIAEGKAAYYGTTHGSVAVAEGRFLLVHHGPVVLAFVVAGLAGLAWRAAGAGRRNEGGAGGRGEEGSEGLERRRAAAELVAYVAGYSALLVAGSKAFRGQFYLPVAPFTALAAAWAMAGLWQRLASRWPLLSRPAVAAAAWLAAALVLLWPTASLTYFEAVPSTYTQAETLLAGSLPRPWLRRVVYERRERSLQPRQGANPMAMVAVERLDQVPPEDLDRADAEVFFGDRLAGAGDGFLLARLAKRAGPAVRLEPRPFRAWGPPLVVIVHGWSLAAEPEPLELVAAGEGAGNRFTAELAAPPASGELVSLSIWVPIERGAPRPTTIRLAGQEATLAETRAGRGRAHYLSSRVRLPEPAGLPLAVEIVDDRELPLPWRPRPELVRWRPPAE